MSNFVDFHACWSRYLTYTESALLSEAAITKGSNKEAPFLKGPTPRTIRELG